MQLHPETPARKAFEECLKKGKKPRGRPKTTWMQTIRQDLNSIGIKFDLSKATKTLNRLLELMHNRKNKHVDRNQLHSLPDDGKRTSPTT